MVNILDPKSERSFWEERLKALVSDIIERIDARKDSPINCWTVNYDKDSDEIVSNGEYELMILSFLEAQKLARK